MLSAYLHTSRLIPIFLSFIIVITSFFDNFLLFHFLAEFFAIFVALCIAVISYHTFSLTKNRYLLFIGLGYLWIGLLDLTHTLTMPQMNIFEIEGLDTTLSIWVLTRLFEALILLFAIISTSACDICQFLSRIS